MMDLSWAWLIGLLITHTLCYFLGRGDGAGQILDEDAQLELEKYKVDKFYEMQRWEAERSGKDE